jgi:hypothetical protein
MLIGYQESKGVGGIIDLLAIAPTGALVLIELKRGRTPRDVAARHKFRHNFHAYARTNSINSSPQLGSTAWHKCVQLYAKVTAIRRARIIEQSRP